MATGSEKTQVYAFTLHSVPLKTILWGYLRALLQIEEEVDCCVDKGLTTTATTSDMSSATKVAALATVSGSVRSRFYGMRWSQSGLLHLF